MYLPKQSCQELIFISDFCKPGNRLCITIVRLIHETKHHLGISSVLSGNGSPKCSENVIIRATLSNNPTIYLPVSLVLSRLTDKRTKSSKIMHLYHAIGTSG